MDALNTTVAEVAIKRDALVAMLEQPARNALGLTAPELEEVLVALEDRLDIVAEDRRSLVLRARAALELALADALTA